MSHPIPFITSSRHWGQSLAVTEVVGAKSGLELISMSHGVKSSVTMKSAPYSSKLFWRLSIPSWHASMAPMSDCLMPGYILSSHISYCPICLYKLKKIYWFDFKMITLLSWTIVFRYLRYALKVWQSHMFSSGRALSRSALFLYLFWTALLVRWTDSW